MKVFTKIIVKRKIIFQTVSSFSFGVLVRASVFVVSFIVSLHDHKCYSSSSSSRGETIHFHFGCFGHHFPSYRDCKTNSIQVAHFHQHLPHSPWPVILSSFLSHLMFVWFALLGCCLFACWRMDSRSCLCIGLYSVSHFPFCFLAPSNASLLLSLVFPSCRQPPVAGDRKRISLTRTQKHQRNKVVISTATNMPVQQLGTWSHEDLSCFLLISCCTSITLQKSRLPWLWGEQS